MPETLWMPPSEKDFQAAKRQFVDLYGSVAVTNTYLKIAVLVLCGVILALVVLELRTQRTFRDFKPLVIRIDDVGHAEAVKYGSLEYHPQDKELKFFLIDFVQRHYSRMRATLRENYSRSLYFLDGRLADALMEANKKSNTLESFLAGAGEEIEVNIRNVSIEDLREPPYRATVNFEKRYLGPDGALIRREKYVANFVFVIKDQVPNAMIPVNPLGLTITYFREDQAFE